MDEFNGAGGMHSGRRIRLGIGLKKCARLPEKRMGANAFAAGEDAVAHGGMYRYWLALFQREVSGRVRRQLPADLVQRNLEGSSRGH